MRHGESEVGIRIFGIAAALLIAVGLSFGFLQYLKVQDQKVGLGEARRSALEARLTPYSDSSVVARDFSHAKVSGNLLYYQTPDGAQQSKADVDALNAQDKARVLKYIKEVEGKLIHAKCFKVDAKDGTWNAGWCSYNVVKSYGPSTEPVG